VAIVTPAASWVGGQRTGCPTGSHSSEMLADDRVWASIWIFGGSYDYAMAASRLGIHEAECVNIDGLFCASDARELATLLCVHWFDEGSFR